MAQSAILAIDQGTTNTKALLVAPDGRILASGSAPTQVEHPHPGWAQQDADAILRSVASAVEQALAAAGPVNIAAIGISNQRESVVVWDTASSRPLGPCVIWQCRRSAGICADLRARGHEAAIRARSGLQLNPMFSAGKLRWLLDNQPMARAAHAEGRLRAGTVDSWLLWTLTGGRAHACDAGNAARTQMLGLDQAAWDDELLSFFGIDPAILPRILPSDAAFGVTAGGFAGLPDGLPIRAMMGDSHAALFGHGIRAPGRAKVTLGTGSSLMTLTQARPQSTTGLSETIAWALDETPAYALEGNITVSTHAAAFAAEMLGLDGPEALTALAASVADSDGVIFVPALAGLGAPHWQEDARGLFCGLSLRTGRAHLARAALEGIAHQICDLVEAMQADLAEPIDTLCVDGGGARNDLLLRLLADLSGRGVSRPAQTELSAWGAAAMAAQAIGQPLPTPDHAAPITPAMAPAQRDTLRRQWRDALAMLTPRPA
jgi:glycerol kinase